MELWEQMVGIKKLIEKENREGGELTDLPCPFCGKPRSQRSDYVRCQPCGLNWLEGEDMSKSPLVSREPFLSSAYNRGTSASKEETDGGV